MNSKQGIIRELAGGICEIWRVWRISQGWRLVAIVKAERLVGWG